MAEIVSIVNKVLYALLFCVLLPLLLWVWAFSVDASFLPIVPFDRIVGIAFMSSGFILLLGGMLSLYVWGKGLPMNLYPPKFYVNKGAYALCKHPIYTGACLLVSGLSVISQSRSAFWIISPVFAACCIALVLGFENKHILHLYGKTHPSLISIPVTKGTEINIRQRLAVFLYLFIPWLLLYRLISAFTINYPYFNTRLPFEYYTVVPEAVIFYSIIYIQVLLIPFIISTQSLLQRFVFNSIVAGIAGFLLMFFLPLVCEQLPFQSANIFTEWLSLERYADSIAGAFPSFHIIWSLLAFDIYKKQFPKYKSVWILLLLLIVLACFLTGMHGMVDVLGGLLIFVFTKYYKPFLLFVYKVTQLAANSWKAYRIGNIRIINHSIFSFLSGSSGAFIAYLFIPNGYIILFIAVCTLMGAAIWAQLIEGSNALLRPFGYYGGIIGGLFSLILISAATSYSFIYLCAVMAMLAPLVQAIGRFRCLVQGCCHGARTESIFAIVVTNEHSRVCKLSGLKSFPIHNTQLYSILSNIVLQLVVIKLFMIGANVAFITGVYFIGSGLFRFVEESYRGEIQTKLAFGLRIYQWFSIISIVLGACITSIASHQLLSVKQPEATPLIFVTIAVGLVGAFALSIDFPASNKKLSRLTD